MVKLINIYKPIFKKNQFELIKPNTLPNELDKPVEFYCFKKVWGDLLVEFI